MQSAAPFLTDLSPVPEQSEIHIDFLLSGEKPEEILPGQQDLCPVSFSGDRFITHIGIFQVRVGTGKFCMRIEPQIFIPQTAVELMVSAVPETEKEFHDIARCADLSCQRIGGIDGDDPEILIQPHAEFQRHGFGFIAVIGSDIRKRGIFAGFQPDGGAGFFFCGEGKSGGGEKDHGGKKEFAKILHRRILHKYLSILRKYNAKK